MCSQKQFDTFNAVGYKKKSFPPTLWPKIDFPDVDDKILCHLRNRKYKIH